MLSSLANAKCSRFCDAFISKLITEKSITEVGGGKQELNEDQVLRGRGLLPFPGQPEVCQRVAVPGWLPKLLWGLVEG